MKSIRMALLGAVAAVFAAGGADVQAQERITLKSASSTSSYYVMMVQLAELLRETGDFSPTVEESQGSVQNVMESRMRPGNFLFTTPPSLPACGRRRDRAVRGSGLRDRPHAVRDALCHAADRGAGR